MIDRLDGMKDVSKELRRKFQQDRDEHHRQAQNEGEGDIVQVLQHDLIQVNYATIMVSLLDAAVG